MTCSSHFHFIFLTSFQLLNMRIPHRPHPPKTSTMRPKAPDGLNEAMSVQAVAVMGLTAAEFSTPRTVQEYFCKAVRAKCSGKLRKERPGSGLGRFHKGETTINLMGLANADKGKEPGEGQDEQPWAAGRRSKRHSVGGYQFAMHDFQGFRVEGYQFDPFRGGSRAAGQQVGTGQFDGLGVPKYQDERRQATELSSEKGHDGQEEHGFCCTGGYHAGGYSTGGHQLDFLQAGGFGAGEHDGGPMFLPQMPSSLKMNVDKSKLGRRHEALGSHPPLKMGTVESANINKHMDDRSSRRHDLPISQKDGNDSASSTVTFEWGNRNWDDNKSEEHDETQVTVIKRETSSDHDRTVRQSEYLEKSKQWLDGSATTEADDMDKFRAECFEELACI